MDQYQFDFVEFLIKQEALLFGKFTLKSGRISPYFFNAGQFSTSYALTRLGQFYVHAIMAADLHYDILFGPAYKGIPIVSSVAIRLYEQQGLDIPYCFNRKEQKRYGEEGNIIGATLKGRVLIVDDVLSSGTTFKESAALIANYKTQLIGIVTAMDREEKGRAQFSATEEIEQQYHVKAISIVKLRHVIEYLRATGKYTAHIEAILDYQEKYGSEHE